MFRLLPTAVILFPNNNHQSFSPASVADIDPAYSFFACAILAEPSHPPLPWWKRPDWPKARPGEEGFHRDKDLGFLLTEEGPYGVLPSSKMSPLLL